MFGSRGELMLGWFKSYALGIGSLSFRGPLSLLFRSLFPATASSALVEEAIKIAPPSPGFYSRLFVTPKVTGGWRPVIDLSRLNGWVDVSHFHMETAQSVLQSLWARGLDGISGSPGYLPPGSGSSIFSPLPEVLHGGCGLPVSLPVLWSLNGSPGIHPRHGSCIFDHASSRFLHSLVPRRLVSPGLHLPLAPSQTQDYFGMTITTSPLRVFPTLKWVQKLSVLLQESHSDCLHPVSV